MPYRLLLVEDDDAHARLFRRICEGMGYEVLQAADGWQALEALGSQSVDLVLMDLRLPGLDGLSATRAIKACPETADLPVVVLTAWPHAEMHAALRAAGAAAVLVKPFARQELVDRLRDALRGRSPRVAGGAAGGRPPLPPSADGR